jgi:hypothetical protein
MAMAISEIRVHFLESEPVFENNNFYSLKKNADRALLNFLHNDSSPGKQHAQKDGVQSPGAE